MVSRLWVLFITRGLALRSDWDEPDEVRGRKLPGPQTTRSGVRGTRARGQGTRSGNYSVMSWRQDRMDTEQ